MEAVGAALQQTESALDSTALDAEPAVVERQNAGVAEPAAADEALRALRDLPTAVADIVDHREQIRDIAEQHVTRRPYWATVGSGLGEAEIRLLHRSGIAEQIRSRTESDTTPSGTKGLAAVQRRVIVARGRRDGRIVVIVPDVSAADGMNLVLLHVDLHERLEARTARRMLEGYGGRYAHVRAAVTET